MDKSGIPNVPEPTSGFREGDSILLDLIEKVVAELAKRIDSLEAKVFEEDKSGVL